VSTGRFVHADVVHESVGRVYCYIYTHSTPRRFWGALCLGGGGEGGRKGGSKVSVGRCTTQQFCSVGWVAACTSTAHHDTFGGPCVCCGGAGREGGG
jgi:hypothetical protein